MNVLNALSQKNINEFKGESPLKITILPGALGYMRMGKEVWDDGQETVDFIRSHQFIIVEEPFPFKLKNNNLYRFEINLDIKIKILDLSKFLMVGIHVRQGDYKYWDNGYLYRDNDFYSELINEICNVRQDIKIVLCHNGFFEFTNKVDFSRSNIDLCHDSVMDDVLNLAYCDVLVGPISTFTQFSKDIRVRAGSSVSEHIYINKDSRVELVASKVAELLSL